VAQAPSASEFHRCAVQEAGIMAAIPVYRRPYVNTQPEYFYAPYHSTAKRAPSQPLIIAPQTLSEVTGPLFGHGEDFMNKLADPKSDPFVLIGSSGETAWLVNPVVCPSPRQMSTHGLR